MEFTGGVARRGRHLLTRIRADASRLSVHLVVLLTALVTIGELAVYVGRPQLAIYIHVLTLLLCVFLPLRLDDDVALTVVKAFLLLPTFRLVNLTMPSFFNFTVLWYPLVYAPILPAGIFIASDLEVPLFRGGRATVWLAPLIVPLSALIGAVEYSIITPEVLIPTDSARNLVLITVVMLLFVGLVEELLYRAILQRTLRQHFGSLPALVIASGLFGLMHSAYGSPLEMGYAAVLGLIYGLIFHRTDSLPLITLLHGALNVFLFGIFPLTPVTFGLPFGAPAPLPLPP